MNQPKQKRMKRVFSTFDQITHLWAHQTQSDARCRNGYYEGIDIYSYGRHYLAARLHAVKGQRVAVINRQKYSVTTAGHLRSIAGACSHLPSFHSSDPKNLELAIRETQAELIETVMNQFSRRSFYQYKNELSYGETSDSYGIIRDIEKFNEAVKVIGFKKYSIDIDDEFISLLNSHAELALQREKELKTPEAIAKREATRLKRQAKALEKVKEHAEGWVKGAALMPGVRELEPQLIRVKGDEVETTRGATVPLSHAKRLLMLVVNGRVKPGDRVGHYNVSQVSETVLKIGCHTISIEQAKQVLGA